MLLCLSAIAEPEAVQLPAMSQPAYPDDEPVIGATVADRLDMELMPGSGISMARLSEPIGKLRIVGSSQQWRREGNASSTGFSAYTLYARMDKDCGPKRYRSGPPIFYL